MTFSSAVTLLAIVRLVHAFEGTPVPVGLYTDIQCETPSTQTPNASIPLGVCAVVPGLGSLLLNPFPCTSGNVHAWAFKDVACGTQSTDFFRLGGNCDGPAYADTYAAIMLNCNTETPGVPTGTTTIPVGAVATQGTSATTPVASAGSSPTTTSANAGSPNTGTPSSSTSATTSTAGASPTASNTSSNASGGGDSLSLGGKIGAIVGGGGGGILAIIILGMVIKAVHRAHEAHLAARRQNDGHPRPMQQSGGGGGGSGMTGGLGNLPLYNNSGNFGSQGGGNGY